MTNGTFMDSLAERRGHPDTMKALCPVEASWFTLAETFTADMTDQQREEWRNTPLQRSILQWFHQLGEY